MNILSKTNAVPIDVTTGIGTGTTAETNSFKIRHSATDGNTMLLQMGASNVAHGGNNNGFGYISAVYWGGSDNNPLWLQPQGGPLQIGTINTTGAGFKGIINTDFAIEAPTQAGNTDAGKLVFTNGANGQSPVFIQAMFDKTQWYQGMGLKFATIAGADISGSSGTERMRITSDGQIRLATYTTTSSWTGTPVGYLQFDSSGNIITASLPGGSSGYTIVNVTTTSSFPAQTSGDIVILVDTVTAGADVTINLPTAVGNTAKFTIKKIDTSTTNKVIVDANSTQTIDGNLTIELKNKNSATLVSNNANWFII